MTENRLTVGLPLRGPLGIGAEYSVYHAERNYADFADVSRRNPQLTTYLSWAYESAAGRLVHRFRLPLRRNPEGRSPGRSG